MTLLEVPVTFCTFLCSRFITAIASRYLHGITHKGGQLYLGKRQAATMRSLPLAYKYVLRYQHTVQEKYRKTYCSGASSVVLKIYKL